MQSRFIVIFLVSIVLSLAGLRPSLAFEDKALATTAAAYQQRITQRANPTDFSKSQSLRRALNFSQQALWQEAIDQYERLLAVGETEDMIWLSLSDAWEQATKTKGQHRQRALTASYLAYTRAISERSQALALFRLGRLYAETQPQQALLAWREGLNLLDDQDIAQRYQQ
jgi:hypothetical protein